MQRLTLDDVFQLEVGDLLDERSRVKTITWHQSTLIAEVVVGRCYLQATLMDADGREHPAPPDTDDFYWVPDWEDLRTTELHFETQLTVMRGVPLPERR